MLDNASDKGRREWRSTVPESTHLLVHAEIALHVEPVIDAIMNVVTG